MLGKAIKIHLINLVSNLLFAEMYESPEGMELRQKFAELDAQGNGYVGFETFKGYINTQPKKLAHYTITRV